MLLEQEATEETPNTNQAIGFKTAKLLLQQQACGKLEALQPFGVNQGRYQQAFMPCVNPYGC